MTSRTPNHAVAHSSVGRPARSRALFTPAIVAGVGVGAVALLHFRDPHVQNSYGICPFHYLTGLWCPGCGGMRAVNDLTNGDLLGSLSSNVIALPLLVVLVGAWVLWVRRRLRGDSGRMIVLHKPATIAVIVFLIVFTVFRNTPWGHWLAPA
ncbi:DUF2752 domain-containing protein [Antrihabitans sp. YC3-6]|uniref:DUF2752 domain-containing protein n=1 Tax=Antrihabitans stalagmiti TaxID=2799499 RepID=A0A934NRV2_9NOCA|nr:DUF2752 domain-containing protein [Antrihabitans stalagmiti]MBJ8340167.1 DUF2752 domain-containing protein [Antrihabitans stalagmiti]